MNYFDDYYTDPQPEEPQPNYIPQEPKQPKPKKERKGMRLVSVLLVLALVIGSCGATAVLMNLHWEKEMKNLTQQMNDKIAAIQKDGGKQTGTVSGRPLASGEYLTPGQVYEQNVDAVVAITVEVEDYDDYGRPVSGLSSGTGFIISADGYVITNHHVIDGGTKVTVTTHDDQEYPAEIVGYEANNDLAVLKVEGENLPCATIGSSTDLLVGDQVVAIGNVLSTFASSLTVGYVSGVDRVVDTQGVAMNMIQTDVAINSGNSGGPLFNMKGEVVGITTAKFSGQSTSGVSIEGIGFAIPVDDVIGIIEDLVEHGYITGAYMGVMVKDMDSSVAQMYGFPMGVYVDEVTAGSCAEAAGMKAKDIIVNIGGYDITSMSELSRALRRFEPGQTTTITVYRGGAEQHLSITLDEKPRQEQTETQPTEPNVQQQIPGSGSIEDWFGSFFPGVGG